MKCPKCGSPDVVVQAVVEQHIVKKRHGFLWWLFIGWWWLVVKWVYLTAFAIVAKIIQLVFNTGRKEIKNVTKAKAVCQSCGHVWEP